MAVRKKSLAEQLAEAANPEPKDYDPEDFENAQLNSGSESEDSGYEDDDKTSHYIPVGRSNIRDDGIALSEGKYKGSRISRRDIEEDEDSNVPEDDDDEEASGGSSENETNEMEEDTPVNKSSNNNGISEILSAEQKHLLSRLNTDKDSDVEKGKAVSAQLKVYEGLLDMRIQSQKILNATNKLSSEGPQDSSPLLPLVQEVLKLRHKLNGESTEDIEKIDLDLTSLAERNKELDIQLSKRRESTLSKWSRKVELSSGKNALQSNRFLSLGQSAALQVNTVLGDMDRLEKRTKVDRSDYGLDETHPWLFDDTDFYRLLLKDLIDRRMADSSVSNGLKWKAAASVSKKKKNVDTKASKGRKLRYNVIEKIQGFDAPRKVFTWTDKQAEDLYSGLLGVKISMDDAEADDSDEGSDTDNVRVTEDFNLFG